MIAKHPAIKELKDYAHLRGDPDLGSFLSRWIKSWVYEEDCIEGWDDYGSLLIRSSKSKDKDKSE